MLIGWETGRGGLFKKTIAKEMTRRGIKMAITPYAIRHPNFRIRYWAEGTQTKIPIPIPEEMIPVGNPRFSLNHCWMMITLVNQPVPPNPIAVIKLKKM
jgi:hypothetical protein